MKRVALVAIPFLALLALACSSSSDGGNKSTPRPGDAVAFDPNLLSSVVLQPEDVPIELPFHETAFNPAGTTSISFASFFRGDGASLSSSVVQYADVETRNGAIDHIRRSLTRAFGPESTFTLAGVDSAFAYVGTAPPALASLVLRGRYVAAIVIQTTNNSPMASDRPALERFSGLMIERLEALLADPSAITPVVGAQTYVVPPTPDPSSATATP